MIYIYKIERHGKISRHIGLIMNYEYVYVTLGAQLKPCYIINGGFVGDSKQLQCILSVLVKSLD